MFFAKFSSFSYSLDGLILVLLDYPDVYFTPYYGHLYSDKWEICCYRSVKLVYHQKPNHHDQLVTPYGYSGIDYDPDQPGDLPEFWKLFYQHCHEIGYRQIVIRQQPWCQIDYSNDPELSKWFRVELKCQRPTYGVDLTQYQNRSESDNSRIPYSLNHFSQYLSSRSKSFTRPYNRAIDQGFQFEMVQLSNLDHQPTKLKLLRYFQQLYYKTMDRLKADSWYYFSDNYFEQLANMPSKYGQTLLATVRKLGGEESNNLMEAAAIILTDSQQTKLHFHLGGSHLNHHNIGINEMLHAGIIQYGIRHGYQLYHLGGGRIDGDSLSRFKSKIANCQFNYQIVELTLLSS